MGLNSELFQTNEDSVWGCFINTPTWFDLIILNHTKNKNVTTPGRESRAETRVMHTQKSFGLFFCCGLPTDGGILTQMQQTECVRNLKYIYRISSDTESKYLQIPSHVCLFW